MSTAASKKQDDDTSGVTGSEAAGGKDSKRSGSRKKDPLIGKTINGRFTILDVIARGGMGKVYRAEQSPLGRICAVKVLNPRYEGDEDPEFQKRFFLEASTAAKLSHSNTVTIFDYGRDEDIYYIAMEFIQGRTLYRILRDDGPLEESRVAHILKQVGRSLREAHGLGVIHRDMKPANVVVVDNADELDAVKVLDFGLVKETGEDSEDLTQQGLFMGSPKYMAPEQILGNQVSPCTDIYALGVLAFELLSGSVPFDEGASVKTLMAHVNDEPPSIYSINPNARVSPQMEAIISRCLRKKPSDRYASMDELLRALTDVQGGGTLTESLRQAPMVSAEILQAAERRSPSWSGPLESGPVSVRPKQPSFPDIPGAMAVPAGAPAEQASSAPSLTGTPLAGTSLNGSAQDAASGADGASTASASGSAASSMALTAADTDFELGRSSSGGKRVGLAIAVVAVLGVAAFFILGRGDSNGATAEPATTASVGTVPPKPTAAPVATTQPTSAATAQPTGDTTATASAAAEDVPRVVRIITDPEGVTVKEQGDTLCKSTPCEVKFDGEVQGKGKQHKLTLLKDGYNPLELRLAADADDIKAKMRRAVAVAPRPTPVTKPPPPTVRPTPPPPANTGDGYKDSPY